MKLLEIQNKASGRTDTQLRSDVTPTISKAGRRTLDLHGQFYKGKFEGENYEPIKLKEFTVGAASHEKLSPSREVDPIEQEYIE